MSKTIETKRVYRIRYRQTQNDNAQNSPILNMDLAATISSIDFVGHKQQRHY